jgi:hypothetical protein
MRNLVAWLPRNPESSDRPRTGRSELGDFNGALELCEKALALDLGAHWQAKRDSLDWAR